jgi:hypothetical protein
MTNQEKTKCAHIPCLYDVAPGQEYCSEACRECWERRGRDRLPMWPRKLPTNGIERGIRGVKA